MTKFQMARYDADLRGSKVLKDNDTLFLTNNLYLPLKTAFNDKLSEIETAKQRQFEQLAPITLDKSEHRQLLINSVFNFSNIGSLQAFNTGHNDLSLSLDHNIKYLSKPKADVLISRAKDLINIMSNNIAILTEITPADITDMEELLSNFIAVKDLPEHEIKQKKSEGTDPIPGLLDDMDVIKKKIGKFILTNFPAVYNTWKNENKVGKPGVRPTSLIVRYIDAETAAILKKVTATMSNELASKVRKSSSLGFSRFYSLDSGNYTLTSEMEGYITDIRKHVGITDNKVVQIHIKLQKIEPTAALDLLVLDKLTTNPLANVQVSIPALNFKGATNDSGSLVKTGIPPASYQGTLYLDTYKKFDFTFTIKSTETLSLQFTLEKEN